MKSFMNFSKLAITTLITSSLFVACSEEISETTVDTQYAANVGNIKNAGQAVDLGLPSGTKWVHLQNLTMVFSSSGEMRQELRPHQVILHHIPMLKMLHHWLNCLKCIKLLKRRLDMF